MALTLRQEDFVKVYLETGNATEAYRRAYNAEKMSENAINVQAYKQVNHPKIALRLKELRGKVAARHDITLDKLTAMALEAYKVGKARKSADGMVGAVKQLARMHGLEVEKRPNERSAFSDLPADVRRSLVADIEALARASSGDREGAAVH